MNANNARSTQSMNGTNSSFGTNGKAGASDVRDAAGVTSVEGAFSAVGTAGTASTSWESTTDVRATSSVDSVISNSKVVSRRHNQLSFRRMLAALGCMVVVVMAVALMVPAVSMTRGDLVCDLEEHAHTDKCYEKVLVCGMEEGEGAVPATDEEPAVEGHKHTKDCYEKKLVCEIPEHEHSDSCYAEPEPEPEPAAEPAPDEAAGDEGVGDTGDDGTGADGADDDGADDDGADAVVDGTADGDTQESAVDADAEANSDAGMLDSGANDFKAEETDDGVQTFHGELKDVTGKVTLAVDAEAPAGALPQGATMKLEAVKRAKVEDAVDAALSDAAARVSDGAAATDAERLAAAKSTAKVESIQAVDIAFCDKAGNEIEPTSDVSVRLSGDQIGQYVEGAGAEGARYAAASAGVAKDVAARPLLVHIANDGAAAMVDVLGKQDLKARDLPTAAQDELVFAAPGFSVYALVYTVDFHWEVDGQTFDFSLPGGGFVSLVSLVDALGIGEGDAREFVAGVARVEFSDPSLVWVGKAEAGTTVGALKDANGLECQYSSELTEDQISEINAQAVEAGDWALVSLQPFTSEETLTVTMTNGDQFVVKVTDAQKAYKDVSTLEEGTYIIYRSDNSSARFMYLKNDGTTKIIVPSNGQSLNANDLSNYTWQVTKNNDGTWTIKSTQGNRYINLYGNKNEYDKWSNGDWSEVSLSGNNGIAIAQNGKVLKRDDDGFYNATGTGVGLTFFKIEEGSSGGSSGTQGIVLSEAERQRLEDWKNTLQAFNTLTDYKKTAEVFNEDNRIYQIDIDASSGVMDFYKDVDLGFVLDISNSMQFPSSLKALETQNGDEYKVWMTADWLNAAKSTYSEYYNKQNCFYIISDPALTSTIYRVFWDGSSWRYQDASEPGNDNILYVNDGTVFKEPYRQTYTLYYADDTKKRFGYLQDSVTYAIDTLKKIVTPTDVVDDETASVRVAYNLFASEIYESDSFKDLRDTANRLFAIPLEYTKSGTRQDLALYDNSYNPSYPWTLDTSDELSANEFGWDTSSDQYVILVTDGAPNGASMSDVRTAAQNLKRQYPNVKIFTIGLSTQDVDGGSQMLYDIADEVGGVHQFYEAEKAKDLEYILLKILRTIMTEGLVRGTITDTIDKGFYPVDAQGNPLSVGVYDANGTRIQNAQIGDYVVNGKPATAHQNEVFYTWELVEDEWKITWYNQEVGWDDNNPSTGNPWTGTVYVKAKEDYLGGNLIETNDGNAQIEPTGIKLVINGTPESTWRPLEDMTPVELPVPRVNVHNLQTKENSTTFTVYKGTTVTPKEQIEALWNAIPIEEVVSASESGQHKITTGSTANIGRDGDGETFTLGSLMSEVAPDFDIDSLINQISGSTARASQEFTYSAYGHESGKIVVKVERTVGDQTPGTHDADTVGVPVEQYKVTFTYKPYSETERMDGKVKDSSDTEHHNGPNGRGDEETGEIKSENTHTINVFQKGIQITKIDKTDSEKTLEGAVFELFRVDENGAANVSSYNLPEGGYTKVGGDLTTDSNGVITVDPIVPDVDSSQANKTLYLPNIAIGETENASHSTVFYLVEKTAPTANGAVYSKMPGAIKFTMELSENKGTDSTATLYDWMQSAVISAEEYQNGAEYLISDGEANNVYSYHIQNGRPTDITLLKVDKTSESPISGAKFRLMRGSENDDFSSLTVTNLVGGSAATIEDYALNDGSGTTVKVVVVPEGGIKISGLVDGAYTLTEVEPPAGYIITDGGKTFEVENGVILNHENEAQDINFKVENEAGAALPDAGGMGTNLLYFFGVMLTGLAGTSLMMRIRRKAA